jgi:hypothetical protein
MTGIRLSAPDAGILPAVPESGRAAGSRRGGMLKFVRSCGKMKNMLQIIRIFTAE